VLEVPAGAAAIVEHSGGHRQRDLAEQIELILPQPQKVAARHGDRRATVERQTKCLVTAGQRFKHRRAEGSRQGQAPVTSNCHFTAAHDLGNAFCCRGHRCRFGWLTTINPAGNIHW
jgi:hypothetical protein